MKQVLKLSCNIWNWIFIVTTWCRLRHYCVLTNPVQTDWCWVSVVWPGNHDNLAFSIVVRWPRFHGLRWPWTPISSHPFPVSIPFTCTVLVLCNCPLWSLSHSFHLFILRFLPPWLWGQLCCRRIIPQIGNFRWGKQSTVLHCIYFGYFHRSSTVVFTILCHQSS